MATLSFKILYKDCGSKLGKIDEVDVFPCNHYEGCILQKGKDYTINVTFSLTKPVVDAKVVVHGIISFIPIPFPVQPNDACVNSGLKCPLNANIKYRYTATLPVKTDYPSVKLIVKWELQDDKTKDDLFCFEAPLKIV